MARPGRDDAGAPPLAGFEGLDRLLEHRLRLGLCVLLARYEELSFARLKELTGETDGNLGANLRKLEDEGYVAARKEFVERKPVTWYGLTEQGAASLKRHVDALAQVVARARQPR